MEIGETFTEAFEPNPLLHAYNVPPLAVRVADCPLQILTVVGDIEAVGFEKTVMLITLLNAVADEMQLAFDVSTQVIWSLLLGFVWIYVALLLPVLLPFTFH